MFAYLVVGLVGGSVYALFALGIVLINNASRVLNIAQGEIGTLSAFVAAQAAHRAGLSLWLAIPLGLLAGAAASGAIWYLVLRRGTAGGQLPPLVGTIAALSVFEVVEARWLGNGQLTLTPLHGRGATILGATVSPTQLLTLGCVIVASSLLWYLLERTSLGLELRSSADNRAAATLVGLRPHQAEATAWILGGLLAAIAGILLSWVQTASNPGFGTLVMPRAFAAAIIGGLSSLPGALVGGAIVGLATAFTVKWFGSTSGSSDLVVFALLFLVLLLRPEGLFGRRARGLASEASESLVSLHALATPPIRRWPVWRTASYTVLGAAIVASLVRLLSELSAYKLTIVPIYVILALSLNFLVTTTGQISLCHVGLLGFGAFMTAIAAVTWEFSFPLALLVGILSTAALAALIGVVAARVRGVHLAVLTLALGIVLEKFLFPLDVFAHGGAGIVVDRPSGPVDLTDDHWFLLLTLVALAAVWLLDRKVVRSPLGRALIGLRENQVASLARGIRPRLAPVAAFAVSGTIAGVAGGLFTYRQGLVAATSFNALLSLTFAIYVVIGGMASRPGVACATALFVVVTAFNVPVLHGQMVTLIGSALLVLSVGQHPEGMGGQVRALLSRRRRPNGDVTAAAGVTATATLTPVPLIHRDAAGPLLRATGLTVRFSGLVALNDVDVEVDEAQVVAVIGPNGAGKTTLFNALSGFVPTSGGRIWLGGRRIDPLPPEARAAAGLGRTFQQGGLWLSETGLGNLLIAQDRSVQWNRFGSVMALGRREHRQESRRRELASRVLDVLRLEHAADVPVRDLPYGVRKTLEIGCALVSRPRLLLLDEPAAGASHREVGELAEVILALPRELGIGVLVIEHHVPLVKQVAENITVLNFGEVLACGPPSDIVSHPAVLEAYLGHAAKAMAAAPPSGRRRKATAAGRAPSTAAVFDPYPTGSDANVSQPSQTPQLALASVSAGYDGVPVLRDLDLTVAKGQFAVVLGSNGAGKTTLLRTIMGQTHVTQGDVVVAGRSLLGLPAAKIVRAGVALAPEGRQLFAGLTVEDNLRAGALARSERHGAAGDPAAMVYDVFPRLAERRTQVAGTLSGGEQQMLAIGRALMSRPELLLIDEASLGLAPVMVESVFGLITRINGTGITVLAVEQNVAVVEHADVVFVLERGQVAFGGPTATVRDRLRDEVLTAYLGQEET